VLGGLLFVRGFHTWRAALLEAGAFAVLAAALSFPSLWVVSNFISGTTNTLTAGGELGNLLHRLSTWQAFGIWPTGDFRRPLSAHIAPSYVLIGMELLALIIGVLWALRRGRGWPLVFFAASLIGWGYVSARSNAWGDAKALMIVSPAVIAAAMLGPASLWELGRRPEALLVAAALAFGVLWTNALAYRGLDLAPHARLSELDQIGHRFAGQGPTLYTEFEEFGKHFLHEDQATGSDESWQDPPHATFANGAGTAFGFSSDIDFLAPSYVQRFRTLVLRRAGNAARPPADYRLAYSGRFYEVWQKTPAPRVLAHLALGNRVQDAGVPRCSDVRALTKAGAGQLAYVERPQLPVLQPTQARHPATWVPDPADPTNLIPAGGAGALTGTVRVTEPSRYTVWVQGSFDRGFVVLVDGRRVGIVQHEQNPRGQYAAAGSIALSPGPHTITLQRPGRHLFHPGDGGRDRQLGPIVLDPASDTRTVRRLPLSGWRSLCGRSLDWIEAIR
jgi:hypothetical protein